MGAGADVYKPVTNIQHQWLSISEYLHKMFISMHMQVIVIVIHAFCKDFSHQLSFGDSEDICCYNEIIMCCYVRYMLKYALKKKMPLNIEIYVLCNSLAMHMEITETYDNMIGLRLLLYMCKAENPHLDDRVEIRGL